MPAILGKYMPILKWKRGEQTALSSLSPQIKDSITPIIEIPSIDFDYDKGIPKKTLDAHISEIGNSIKSAWQQNEHIYLDLCSFSKKNSTTADGKHPMEKIMADLRLRTISGIPVTGFDRDVSYQNEVKKAFLTDHNGLCIRLKIDDSIDIKSRIKHLLTITSSSPQDVDLLIDFEYIIPGEENKNFISAQKIIKSLPHLMNWRRLVFCSTSFPETLPSVLNAGNVQRIPRSEKKLWNMLIKSGLQRIPDFGDYTIANPKVFDMNPRLMTVSANIRYTGKDDFIIFKGRAIKKNGWGQIIPMAQSVIAHNEYSGPHFSAGDKFIWDVAHRLLKKKNGTDTTGNSETWRTVGTNHHITFVVTELSNLTLP